MSHSFTDLLSFEYRDSEEYQIMAVDLECYFDGGNQADSREYDLVTLSVISGTPKQWRKLEEQWKQKCDERHIGYFHATEHKDRLELMEDFTEIASTHVFQRSPFCHGLYPFSVTVPLDDFLRARAMNHRTPHSVPDILIREALYRCVEWGMNVIGSKDFHIVFDRGEPYMGLVSDFKRNPKSRREYPIVDDFALTEGNSRKYPGLQMADLFAFGHSNRKSYFRTKWHQSLREITQDRVDFTFQKLLDPIYQAIEKSGEWKLPKRAATK
jgi:hypothetical protein